MYRYVFLCAVESSLVFFVFVCFEKLLRSSMLMRTGIEFVVMAALIHLIEIIRYSFFLPEQNSPSFHLSRTRSSPLRIIAAIVNTVAN